MEGRRGRERAGRRGREREGRRGRDGERERGGRDGGEERVSVSVCPFVKRKETKGNREGISDGREEGADF